MAAQSMGRERATMSDTANPPETPTAATRNESSVDDGFDVLAAGRRRTTLAVLSERRRPTDCETLARAVASRERGTARENVSDDTVERVHVRLHHVHLPKLDGYGLVDYDRENGVVEPTGDGTSIAVE